MKKAAQASSHKNKSKRDTLKHASHASKLNLAIFIAIFAAIGGYVVFKSLAATTNCSSINQYGITINFNKTYICGTFANGDYWVAPDAGDTGVVITSMSPAFSAGQNGWEVNPVYSGGQGFDSDMDGYDASLVPALPYTATGNKSIVKATTASGGCPNNVGCLQSAIVLTVLSSVPPGDGANIFRPPYVGTAKPLYTTTQLQTQLLPSLSVAGYTPPPISSDFHAHRLQLDHKDGLINRNMHPIDNMHDYGSQIAQDINDGIGRLMFNDSVSAKMPLLIDMVQGGMDRYYMTLQGQTWVAPGPGHNMGRKLSIVFAATMLNDPTMKSNIQTQPNFANFHEDQGQIIGKNGVPLWGGWDEYQRTESEYWAYIAGGQSSNEDVADPYGYIDGGTFNGDLDSYQFCCTSQPWKGSAMILHLMPSMESIWQNHDKLETYIDRWVTYGAHYQPDPCAPVAQGGGPLPGNENPAQCILDPDLTPGSTFTNFSCQAGKQCGRFPALDGQDPDGGWNRSDIIDTLWTAYRGLPPPPPPTGPSVSLTASPTTITTGNSSTLTWTTANATSCTAGGAWSGSKATSGNQSVSPTSNSTYTLSCTGPDGTNQASAIVSVIQPGDITIGETNILNTGDSGNANLLLAQSATVPVTATVKSLSFYVTTAAGKLRMGIYDSTGPSGGPGALKAQTAEITPVAGWNTVLTTTQPSLAPGTYWLAYLPSDNGLAFVKTSDASSSGRYYTFTYGSLPGTFSTSPTSTSSHFSLYATLNTGSGGGSSVPGDCNGDGHVNLSDLTVMLANLGTSAAFCDFNSDNTVNVFDISILMSHYGS